MTILIPSGLPGSSRVPKVGLGKSVLAKEIFGWRATGPFTLFSVSSNTIEVLLRLRERLQSALLQEQGAAARLLVAFYLWIPAKVRSGQARPRRSQTAVAASGCLGRLLREWSCQMNKRQVAEGQKLRGWGRGDGRHLHP